MRGDIQRLPLYAGGFLGPFGTLVILPMFPELRDAFDASSGAVGWGYTLYFIPFAVFLLVSGTVGERFGRRRVVRTTFILYAAASLVCAAAPSLGWFLLGRALQGFANAFITPLLLAGLADLVPPERFGRTVGIYGTFQALGSGLAPVIGGLATVVNWRWAFVGTALAAGVLALWPPPGEPRLEIDRPPIRPLFSRRMVTLGIGALFGAAGPMGVQVLVGVAARDELGLSGAAAGAVLLVGSLTATVASPGWGRLLDLWGERRVAVIATFGLSGLGSLLAFAISSTAATVVVWAVVGAFASAAVAVFQSLAATAVPKNRGGALSATLSYRFVGHAIGPIVWLAVFETNPSAAFLGSAALGVVMLAAILVVTSDTRDAA